MQRATCNVSIIPLMNKKKAIKCMVIQIFASDIIINTIINSFKIMIKVYKTIEEKKAAFKRSVGLRKVWEDMTSGKMSFKEFKRQGYNTVKITE